MENAWLSVMTIAALFPSWSRAVSSCSPDYHCNPGSTIPDGLLLGQDQPSFMRIHRWDRPGSRYQEVLKVADQFLSWCRFESGGLSVPLILGYWFSLGLTQISCSPASGMGRNKVGFVVYDQIGKLFFTEKSDQF